MKIGILTSSRADFGYYIPLLKAMGNDTFFHFEIIAFGTHLSKFHGYTLNEINNNGFCVKFQVPSLLVSDDPESISTSYALTALKFASFWKENQHAFDLVFCLGDRFEMAAAVMAGVPFNIRFVHFYGGETTLGAIDNIYRHAITLASRLCFTSTTFYAEKVRALTGNETLAVVAGSLSLENIKDLKLLSLQEFKNQWKIDLQKASILVTLHPETVSFEKNKEYIDVCFHSFSEIAHNYQLIITMPNADTNGTLFRESFKVLKGKHESNVFLIENFGTQSYFTCLKYADLIIGNSSSGIIEAASFQKYVVNLGDRQKGRLSGDNVIHIPFNVEKIISTVKMCSGKKYLGENIYYQENATKIIIQTLKSLGIE